MCVRLSRRQGKPRSPIALFNAIFRRFLDLLKAEIAKLSETLNSIEDHIVGENWQGERERLVPVRRQIVVFHRYLTAATSLFRHIDHADRRVFPEELDDLIEGLSRRAETLHAEGEQLQQRARLLQDELLAKLTDQSNQFLYVLSVMTAVLLPSTVISGLFGMNTGGLPLAESSTWILDCCVCGAGNIRNGVFARAKNRRIAKLAPLPATVLRASCSMDQV